MDATTTQFPTFCGMASRTHFLMPRSSSSSKAGTSRSLRSQTGSPRPWRSGWTVKARGAAEQGDEPDKAPCHPDPHPSLGPLLRPNCAQNLSGITKNLLICQKISKSQGPVSLPFNCGTTQFFSRFPLFVLTTHGRSHRFKSCIAHHFIFNTSQSQSTMKFVGTPNF